MKKLIYIIRYDDINWAVTMSQNKAERQMSLIRESILNGTWASTQGFTAEDAISEEDNNYKPIHWGEIGYNCEYVMRFKIHDDNREVFYVVCCEQHVLNANMKE